MARIAPYFLAALALVAVFATAEANIYDDNIKAFSAAIRKNPDYSVFAKYYVQYGTSNLHGTYQERLKQRHKVAN